MWAAQFPATIVPAPLTCVCSELPRATPIFSASGSLCLDHSSRSRFNAPPLGSHFQLSHDVPHPSLLCPVEVLYLSWLQLISLYCCCLFTYPAPLLGLKVRKIRNHYLLIFHQTELYSPSTDAPHSASYVLNFCSSNEKLLISFISFWILAKAEEKYPSCVYV